MTREEAIALQSEAFDYQRRGNWEYDDAKALDSSEYNAKDYHFNKSREYWIKRDLIKETLSKNGFDDLVEEIRKDIDG